MVTYQSKMSKKINTKQLFNKNQKVTFTEKQKEDYEKVKNMDDEVKLKIVKDKVMKNSDTSPKKLDDFCKNLYNEESIMKTYLNKDHKELKEYFNMISSTKKGVFDSVNTVSKSESVSSEKKEDLALDFDDDIGDLELKTNEKLKIKLVITEVAKTKKAKDLRQVLSPFASALNINPKFGMFHSALIIGP